MSPVPKLPSPVPPSPLESSNSVSDCETWTLGHSSSSVSPLKQSPVHSLAWNVHSMVYSPQTAETTRWHFSFPAAHVNQLPIIPSRCSSGSSWRFFWPHITLFSISFEDSGDRTLSYPKGIRNLDLLVSIVSKCKHPLTHYKWHWAWHSVRRLCVKFDGKWLSQHSKRGLNTRRLSARKGHQNDSKENALPFIAPNKRPRHVVECFAWLTFTLAILIHYVIDALGQKWLLKHLNEN